jgi:hypothetical protein
MKTKRQKHKEGKARSIATRAAKKSEAESSDESEASDVARTAEPPKKKPKLNLPSSPGRLAKPHPPPIKRKPDTGITNKTRSKTQHKPSKESQVTDEKAIPESQRVEKRKKRKEVTSDFTPALPANQE